MVHTPRGIFALINADEEEVLSSNTPWFCVSCYAYAARCPQQIPITDIMCTLKEMAIQAGRYEHPHVARFSETFIGSVKQRGRSFEAGLATRYHLFHPPQQVVSGAHVTFDQLIAEIDGILVDVTAETPFAEVV
jgi:heterodisulfide reductase subunit C